MTFHQALFTLLFFTFTSPFSKYLLLLAVLCHDIQ